MQPNRAASAQPSRGIILVLGSAGQPDQALATQLREQEFKVLVATGPTTALFMLGSLQPDLAFITAGFGFEPGEMVRAMRVVDPNLPLVIDAAELSIEARERLTKTDSLRALHEGFDLRAVLHALDELMPSKSSGTRRLF